MTTTSTRARTRRVATPPADVDTAVRDLFEEWAAQAGRPDDEAIDATAVRAVAERCYLAASDVPDGEIAPLREHVETHLQRHERNWPLTGEVLPYGPPPWLRQPAARRAFHGELSTLRRLLDRIVAVHRHREALAAAEEATQDAETRTAQARADIERAVLDVDVDRVMSLRSQLEVNLPADVARARHQLLEVQARIAADVSAAAGTRLSDVQAIAARLADERDAAERTLESAKESADRAASLAANFSGDRRVAGREEHAAQQALEDHIEEAKRQAQQTARQLAGGALGA